MTASDIDGMGRAELVAEVRRLRAQLARVDAAGVSAYHSAIEREQRVRGILGAERSEDTETAAARVMQALGTIEVGLRDSDPAHAIADVARAHDLARDALRLSRADPTPSTRRRRAITDADWTRLRDALALAEDIGRRLGDIRERLETELAQGE